MFESYSRPTKLRKMYKSEAKREPYSPFRIIFFVAMVLGLCVSHSFLKRKQKKMNVWIKLWCFLVTLLKTIIIVFFCLYTYLLLPSMATRVTYYSYSIFGYLNHLAFIRNRRKIVTAIQSISCLTAELNQRTRIRKSAITLHLLIAFFAASVLGGLLSQFFFFVEWDNQMERLKKYLTFIKNDLYYYYFVWMIAFSTVWGYTLSAITSYVILLLCTNAYHDTSQLFVLYETRLKTSLGNFSTSMPIAENAALFRSITVCVKEVDQSLNACTFLIYTTMITSFFNTISVVLSETMAYRNALVDAYVACTFLFSLIVFFIITFSGANVSEKSNTLKAELTELSDMVIRQSPDTRTILTINLLFETIKSSKCYVTGLGLFYVTKEFILSVAGMLITYGVLIYQIGITKGVES